MKHVCSISMVLALMANVALAAGQRTWTDQTGKQQVEAALIDFNETTVWLKRSDGRLFAVDLEELSEDDRQHVAELAKKRDAAIAAQEASLSGTIRYAMPRRLGILAATLVDESSGLACSRRSADLFWTHNDSGDDARLYAFDRKGHDLGSIVLGGIRAYDWEDMASFSLDGKDYLLVGDVGNNGRNAAVQVLYLVEEPDINPIRVIEDQRVEVVQTMHFSYADAYRDCEALAVDPTSRTILLATKESDRLCHVYALAWPKNDPEKATTARRIATLSIPTVTAMDISPDGRRAVLLTYGNAYEYTRAEKETWTQAFSHPGRILAMPRRRQGETICYGRDGKHLYLTSESAPTPLFEIPAR